MARAATHDEVVLGVLVYQVASGDRKESERHPRVAKFQLAWLVPFCVFTYYVL